MKIRSSGADEQNLGRQEAEPADEYDVVKIHHRLEGRLVGLKAPDDLWHEPHEDPEPDQRHHQQKEIAVQPMMVGERRRYAASLRRRSRFGRSRGTPEVLLE